MLRPFNRFLGQAIHTAKQRRPATNSLGAGAEPSIDQTRASGQLTACAAPAYPASSSPTGHQVRAHDFAQMGFVINRGVPVRFETATPTADGLLVRTDVPLSPADRVLVRR